MYPHNTHTQTLKLVTGSGLDDVTDIQQGEKEGHGVLETKTDG